jgi:hypothetical protein
LLLTVPRALGGLGLHLRSSPLAAARPATTCPGSPPPRMLSPWLAVTASRPPELEVPHARLDAAWPLRPSQHRSCSSTGRGTRQGQSAAVWRPACGSQRWPVGRRREGSRGKVALCFLYFHKAQGHIPLSGIPMLCWYARLCLQTSIAQGEGHHGTAAGSDCAGSRAVGIGT